MGPGCVKTRDVLQSGAQTWLRLTSMRFAGRAHGDGSLGPIFRRASKMLSEAPVMRGTLSFSARKRAPLGPYRLYEHYWT